MAISNCALFDSEVGVRLEDKLKDLKVRGLGIGSGMKRRYHFTGGSDRYPGYENEGEHSVTDVESLLKHGVKPNP